MFVPLDHVKFIQERRWPSNFIILIKYSVVAILKIHYQPTIWPNNWSTPHRQTNWESLARITRLFMLTKLSNHKQSNWTTESPFNDNRGKFGLNSLFLLKQMFVLVGFKLGRPRSNYGSRDAAISRMEARCLIHWVMETHTYSLRTQERTLFVWINARHMYDQNCILNMSIPFFNKCLRNFIAFC